VVAPDKIMPLKKVARLLKVAGKTVYTMAHNKGSAGVQDPRPVAIPARGHRPLDRPAEEDAGRRGGLG